MKLDAIASTPKVLKGFNSTAHATGVTGQLGELFREQVKVRGESPAIYFMEWEWSYADLGADANRLGYALASR